MPGSAAIADPATDYASAVCGGEILAGELVRLACERHLRDQGPGGRARGLKWKPEVAQDVFDFFEGLLKHSKGKWAGRAFTLQPWQHFALGSLFGWFKDKVRRFTIGHVEVARKNGKTTLASGVGLKLLVVDGEPGAEVYTAATKKDQARITHEESVRMVKASPDLAESVRVFKSNLSVEATDSKYEPLTAEGDSLDGLNVHGAILDELHAWKQRLLWDVLETATGARRQPLFLVTTTAGVGRGGIWWERREAAIRALKARGPEDAGFDDSLFALIYTLDDGDDWTDEKNWVKANPSLGVTVRVEELREKCRQARETPGKQNPFKRLRLNVPTEQVDRWLDLAVWDEGADATDPESLKGRPCWGGLDLAKVKDLSALALLFPPQEEGEKWKLLTWFWVPEEDVGVRSKRDRVDYDRWAAGGRVVATPGNTTDFRFIQAEISRLCQVYDVRRIAFDRMFAGPLVNDLTDEGVPMLEFGQGFLSMAQPTAEFERLVVGRQLQHDGHPVMRWCVGNVAVRQDPAGNLKPDKGKSTERIDGVVAAVMALGAAMADTETGGTTVEVW